ncbi:hypothetical protein [Bradyrhizobium sp. DASA03120]|uniref:hypothetical protein n=1 Tax=Bradyrhizobium sp. SMVTL-02 TaxID=3395917 RepID=UPI003F6FA826
MPTEQEELKLIVSLVDNASAGLDKIVEKTKEMGGPQVKEAHEKMRRGTEELNKAFKEITGGFGDAFKALGSFRGGLVAGAGGLALFGVEMTRQIGELKKWAEELRGISQAARSIGVDPASMKNIISQFEAIGVSADQTKANLGKMSEAVADLNRQGSSLRRELLHMAGPSPQAQQAMRELLNNIVNARTEEERYNAVVSARANVLRHALEEGKTLQEATQRANEFASHFWDRTIANMDKLNGLSAEDRRIQTERIKQAERLANLTGQISSEWADIIEDLKAPFLDPAIKAAEKFLEISKEIHEWLKKNYDLAKPDEAKKSIQDTFGKFRGPLQLGTPPEDQQKATEQNTEAQKRLKESNDALIDALKSGFMPMSYTGGGVGRNPLLQNASFTTGGDGGFRYGGGGGYGPFGGGRGFGGGGGAPYGSSVGPGSGAGAGSTPAHGGGGGGAGPGAPVIPGTPGGGPDSGYNYFQKRGQAPLDRSQLQAVQTPYGRIMANPAAAADLSGFMTDLAASGAPVKRFGDYNKRQKRWGGGWSSHAYGTAWDVNDQQFFSPEMRDWLAKNPDKWKELQNKYNIGQPLANADRPWEGKDPAHLEWRGPHGTKFADDHVGPGTGAGAGETPATADGAHGAGGVADQRALMMAEVNKDPVTKELLYRMMKSESGGTPTVEALMNRVQMVRQKVPGYSIGKELRSGFYGPINKGITRPVSENERAQFDKNLAEAVGGSDYIKGRTNQGMESDPGARLPGRVPGYKEVYNYWEGRRGGVNFSVADSARFAREQLDRRMAAANKVEGSGKISVDVNAPKGTRVDAQGGGIFKDVEINRQTQMDPARKGPETLSI